MYPVVYDTSGIYLVILMTAPSYIPPNWLNNNVKHVTERKIKKKQI